MSSADQERAETRAGHPPAVKAGGMRIVQKHPHTPDAKEEKDKDDQEWESSRACSFCAKESTSSDTGTLGGDCSAPRIVQGIPATCNSLGTLSRSASLDPPKPTVFISGVIARGDKDFPPAAAQVAHQKPHPSVEKLPHPQHVNQHINQPRK
ncbi:death-associated protein 1 [Gopherus flavomarginatus]|uniref:death-associated protein 1 n=1 Tax=Gopherus flavomarginatus TaxID=286002 RepID=UPI0011CFC30B|nr:death-associated protein 1 isoform X1 [Gopherus evgoodei]XP_050793571.1 death-associated protein 1 [Gopherus flavomarginatus]